MSTKPNFTVIESGHEHEMALIQIISSLVISHELRIEVGYLNDNVLVLSKNIATFEYSVYH